MSFFDKIQFLTQKTVKVTCPGCQAVTEQLREKVRKNSTLVCPKCGTLFRSNTD
ncbi:YnfU family zinc-binding protein [Rouxiella sp. Mn2063]|uniref:YnfU family zinc-binding protein n=1 Tax=Rouxiella sp. Mn2063 TaxID=3395262 RepID=UPI003BC0EF0E